MSSEQTNAELLPCPHCGESEELYPAYRAAGGKPYAIDCLGCGSDFVPREGTDAIEAWNRRPSRLEAISEAEPVADGGFFLQEREDDMLICAKHWRDGARCIARRPKMLTNEQWRPQAEAIIRALYAHTPPAGHVAVPVEGLQKLVRLYEEDFDDAIPHRPQWLREILDALPHKQGGAK